MIAGLFSTALVAAIFALVIGHRRREVRQARARRIAADTWARHQRQERANAIAREVTGAFDQALAPRPHLCAVKARSEATVLDDDAAVAAWLRGAR